MANDDHLDLAAPDKARLTRDSKYRDNGHTYIKGCGRKERYGGPALQSVQAELQARGTQPLGGGCAPGSVEHARRYTFTYKRNFTLGITPYPNQGHHMLPEEAFGEKMLGRKCRYLIAKVPYDINHGPNIIFLPVYDRDSAFHQLPYHGGSHPKYTSLVQRDMKKVKKELQGVIDAEPDHKKWNPPGDIRSQLEQLESQYWDFLTSVGPVSVNVAKKPARTPGSPTTAAKPGRWTRTR